MKKAMWGFLYALFLSLTASSTAKEASAGGDELTLFAKAAVLMDASSGRVLYGKNQDEPMPMASTTKILTCILVLENVSMEEELTVSAYATTMPKVKLYLKKGERYRVEDLLYSMMLESHNDSALALAEHVGKKLIAEEWAEKEVCEFTTEESKKAVSAFARLMNQKAVDIGCKDSWFITPNGLDATQELIFDSGEKLVKEHCTTASELALILSYCIEKSSEKEAFLEITERENYCFSANNRSYSLNNHNAFLHMMEGALTGKTGFTNKAGYCYVGALEKDDRTFVVALLACGWPNNKGYKWKDTGKLMKYGIDNYYYQSFSDPKIAFDENSLRPIPVIGGKTELLGEQAYVKLELKGSDKNGSVDPFPVGTDEENLDGILLRKDEKVEVNFEIADHLNAPVEVGEEAGKITYSVENKIYRQDIIQTSENKEKADLAWCMEQVLGRYLCRIRL